MADPPPYPDADSGEENGAGPDRGASASPPRWVPVLVIVIAIVLVLLIVVSHLAGIVGPGAH